MNHTSVYLKGAIEPLVLNEPLQATMLNMSAAVRSNLVFFQGKDTDDRDVVVSIGNVLFMRDESDEYASTD